MAELPEHRTCGAYEVHLAMLRTNPAYAAARAAIDAHASEFARAGRIAERTGTTVIPVVVHVIYRAAAENISDAQIVSQIDVLNRDYRKSNPDVGQTPAPFQPFAGDARVEFALASTDPQGQPTNGITRTQTNVPQFTSDNAMKFTSQGGHDAWDSTRYLNIWVCPEIISPTSGALLGYAQFPGGPAATDGVAIAHNAFGTTGTAAAPYNLGRTATHEVGHWLNLFHIWGDRTDCTGDDQVADTPTQQAPNFGSPAFPHVTCNNGPNGDMFMNYMDYVNDAAMFMFTNGQIVRMQATLSGSRSTLGSQAFAAKVDLAAATVQAQNARFSAGPGMMYNTQFGGWLLGYADANFQVGFDLASIPSTDFTLTLLHCTSSLWPADGFSPVNIDVNSTSLKANFDPATAHRNTGADTRGYVWDHFVIPKNSLRTGANSIKITGQSGMRTKYWIRSLQLDA
jgi:Pregnancy-associated plasma protein-A